MSPWQRRLLQAVLYELGAVLLVTPIVALSFDHDTVSAFWLSVLMSLIAVAWNYLFNAIFEWWESTRVNHQRTVWVRFLHGLGFEGGLTLFFVPLMAYWLSTSYWLAFVADVSLLVLFVFYTMVFTWCFDKIFGLPASAQR